MKMSIVSDSFTFSQRINSLCYNLQYFIVDKVTRSQLQSVPIKHFKSSSLAKDRNFQSHYEQVLMCGNANPFICHFFKNQRILQIYTISKASPKTEVYMCKM